MTIRIGAVRRPLTDRAARWILGRCALAAIGASLAAISASTFGADLATGSSLTITGPSQVKRADHRPITAQPSAALDTKLDYLAAHSRIVDQLYEEMMRWAPPGCSPVSTDASMAGRC
jgi:hypothetical protein